VETNPASSLVVSLARHLTLRVVRHVVTGGSLASTPKRSLRCLLVEVPSQINEQDPSIKVQNQTYKKLVCTLDAVICNTGSNSKDLSNFSLQLKECELELKV